MVFILHRYIFRELLKIFLLTTLALTLIMSLGSIFRPVQEYGIGPRQVLHLLSYFIPITLTFVLPIAALFATTLVYGRFSSDNEFDACRASGVSVVVVDSQGDSHTINFSRPEQIQTHVEVDISASLAEFGGGDQVVGEQQVKEAIKDLGDSLAIGDDIIIVQFHAAHSH